MFLVDYGLAFRYSADGRHKEYKEDPRRAHDGTIEFTSTDAHKGVGRSLSLILFFPVILTECYIGKNIILKVDKKRPSWQNRWVDHVLVNT